MNKSDGTINICDSNRCKQCNKNISLLSFKCKCNNYYCIKHLYSDLHDCKYDYKEESKKQLIKMNPLISSKKIESI